jgi:hypothetical protein
MERLSIGSRSSAIGGATMWVSQATHTGGGVRTPHPLQVMTSLLVSGHAELDDDALGIDSAFRLLCCCTPPPQRPPVAESVAIGKLWRNGHYGR